MAYTTIDDPSAYFQTAIWSGTGSALSVTFDGNSDMQPDMVWVKNRTTSSDHRLSDSVRGTSSHLVPNDAAAIDTSSTALTAFNSDGFSVGSEQSYSKSGSNHVGWAWKAGTSFTNDASGTGIGTIDSAGSVNTDAGFSITKFTADGNNLTAAHGLGVAPTMIITKNLSISKNWSVYHSSLGAGKAIFLNVTDVADTDNTYWNNTAPTSTTLSYGTWSGNNNGNEIIAYCFAEKKGYSKVGSYTGNGNADGTFVYTGQKSAFIMIKASSRVGTWNMYDVKRSTFNNVDDFITANTPDAETTGNTYQNIDILSNGFKCRGTGTGTNESGSTYIYMAFAENPFVTSTGVPATAR
jgi:hypothetical protein